MKRGTQKESNLKFPHLNSSLPSLKAWSNIFLLRSWLPNSTGPGSWPDNGTKRRVMTSSLRLLLCRISTSVDTSPAPEKHGPSLVAPGKEKLYQLVLNLHESTTMVQTWRNFHGSTSRSANSILLGRRAPHHKLGSGTARNPIHHLLRAINRLSGRFKRWNTKPHDPIFMNRRALSTSLWRIWIATLILPQIKANEIWRMGTNTMAN